MRQAGWIRRCSAPLKQHGSEGQMEAYAALKEAFLAGKAGSLEQLNALKKSATGRVIHRSERESLEILEHMLVALAQEAPQIFRVETDFYRNSVRMGNKCEKDGGYSTISISLPATPTGFLPCARGSCWPRESLRIFSPRS